MDSMYSDEGEADAQMPPSSDPEPGTKEDHSGEKTAVLDSDICPGMKPGDELVLKVLRVLDKQYEVAYAPKEEKEEGSETGEEAAPQPQPGKDSDLASMME